MNANPSGYNERMMTQMPIKITITDDRGYSKTLDFDRILTRDSGVPAELSVHARIMKQLDGIPPGELRSKLVQEQEDEAVKGFVLGYLMVCERCDHHVLHDHGWVRERVPGDERSEEIVCDACVPPPSDELERRKNGPPVRTVQEAVFTEALNRGEFPRCVKCRVELTSIGAMASIDGEAGCWECFEKVLG
jgi:hypothetical protein